MRHFRSLTIILKQQKIKKRSLDFQGFSRFLLLFPVIVVSALSSPSARQSRTPVAEVIPECSPSPFRLVSHGITPTLHCGSCYTVFCSLLATFISFYSIYSTDYFYSSKKVYSICTQRGFNAYPGQASS